MLSDSPRRHAAWRDRLAVDAAHRIPLKTTRGVITMVEVKQRRRLIHLPVVNRNRTGERRRIGRAGDVVERRNLGAERQDSED